MVIRINDEYLAKLFQGEKLPGKPRFSKEVILKFKKTMLVLVHAENIAEIRKFKGLNLESLEGKYSGYYSVRVDLKYRLILKVEGDNILTADTLSIEELTNHYQ